MVLIPEVDPLPRASQNYHVLPDSTRVSSVGLVLPHLTIFALTPVNIRYWVNT